jgi:hypothetical protein
VATTRRPLDLNPVRREPAAMAAANRSRAAGSTRRGVFGRVVRRLEAIATDHRGTGAAGGRAAPFLAPPEGMAQPRAGGSRRNSWSGAVVGRRARGRQWSSSIR